MALCEACLEQEATGVCRQQVDAEALRGLSERLRAELSRPTIKVCDFCRARFNLGWVATSPHEEEGRRVQ